jgi:hypothetical protein
MSIFALTALALVLAVPVSLGIGHLLVVALKTIADRKSARSMALRPRLLANSARGGEASIRAMLAVGERRPHGR